VTVFFPGRRAAGLARREENGMTVSTAREIGPRPVRPGRSIVRLSGSLDFAAAKELRERLIDVLHRGASPLIIDLSRVPSGDAAGLAVLIGTQRRARLLGSEMLLAAPSLSVAELLRSTGLHRHFTVYPDIPAALASQRNALAVG
jgi:anti-anti-sigma factor